MMTVAAAYLAALIAALLIGVVVAFWAFRRGQQEPGTVIEASPPPREVEAPAPELHVPPTITPRTAGTLDPLAPPLEIVTPTASDVPLEEPGPSDDLQTLKGVGAKFAARLNENGITRFDQLARLGAADVGLLDERMGAFKGRLTRDRIVEQAGYLARGDRAGFEAQFGKLGGAG